MGSFGLDLSLIIIILAVHTNTDMLDGAGHKQTLRVIFASIIKLKKFEQKLPSEVPSSMTDPIEKEIVSILQLEQRLVFVLRRIKLI